jgi:hypothetical protein
MKIEHEKCKYNPFVNCDDEYKKCHKCGWNPDVDKKRKEEGKKK